MRGMGMEDTKAINKPFNDTFCQYHPVEFLACVYNLVHTEEDSLLQATPVHNYLDARKEGKKL